MKIGWKTRSIMYSDSPHEVGRFFWFYTTKNHLQAFTLKITQRLFSSPI